jgi:small subunit ribosomal protein S6
VKKYEAMVLIDSGYAAAHWKEAVAEITEMFKRHGCEIVRLVKWDDRKLAYQIGPHKRGTYVLCFYKAPFDANVKIERDVQLSDNLLRLIIVRRDRLTEEQMLRYMTPSNEPNIIGETLAPLPVAPPPAVAPRVETAPAADVAAGPAAAPEK